MTITVKKKKLTVKTVKAKAGDLDAPVEAAGAPAAAAPTAAAAAPPVKQTSYTLAGIFAIIAFLLFTALLILQGMEFAFYKDAIPRPLSPGMAAPPPAYSTDPAGPPTAPAEAPAELSGENTTTVDAEAETPAAE